MPTPLIADCAAARVIFYVKNDQRETVEIFYVEEYAQTSDLFAHPAWEQHDPYSLDVPKHPLYLQHEQTNSLHKLVTPTPPMLQSQLARAYHEIHTSSITPVLFIHAESMQTEKTKNMTLFAWQMQQYGLRTLFMMPAHAVGDAHQRGETPDAGFVVSRAFPQKKMPALVVTSNSLHAIRDQLAAKGITPATTDLLCIDEIQLFTEQTPLEAIAGLLQLQQAGFSIVMNGIDYDFKADPFTHMHHVLLMARFLPGWQTFQLATMCRHCSHRARGSRRVLTFPDGRTHIADATSPIVMPGLSHYYAVCDIFHKPCTRLTSVAEHIRPPLPTSMTLEQIQRTPWMQATLAHFSVTPLTQPINAASNVARADITGYTL